MKFIHNDLLLIRDALLVDAVELLEVVNYLLDGLGNNVTDDLIIDIYNFELDLMRATIDNQSKTRLTVADITLMVKMVCKYKKHYIEGIDKHRDIFYYTFWLGGTLGSLRRIEINLDPVEKDLHKHLWWLRECFGHLMAEAAMLKKYIKVSKDYSGLANRKAQLADDVAYHTEKYIKLIEYLVQAWTNKEILSSLTPLLLTSILEKQKHLLEHIHRLPNQGGGARQGTIGGRLSEIRRSATATPFEIPSNSDTPYTGTLRTAQLPRGGTLRTVTAQGPDGGTLRAATLQRPNGETLRLAGTRTLSGAGTL